MFGTEYYRDYFHKLSSYFNRSDWFLAEGRELIEKRGFRPYDKFIAVERLDTLHDLSVMGGMDIFVPVVGKNSDAIMFPFDFEVAFPDNNRKIYTDPASHKHFFMKYAWPSLNYFVNFFNSRNVPGLIDATPSGGHFLFYALRGKKGWDDVKSIGYVHPEHRDAALQVDYSGRDLKRQHPLDLDSCSVWSGMGRLALMIALKMKQDCSSSIRDLEIRISDSKDSGNFSADITPWGDPAWMRIMRVPGSLHRKNELKHEIFSYGPLVDVIIYHYDTQNLVFPESDGEVIHSKFWNLEEALHHNLSFPGFIPFADGGLSNLVEEYRHTDLPSFFSDFDNTPDLAPGEGRHRVLNDSRLDYRTRDMSLNPYSRMLNPLSLRYHIADLLSVGWNLKHVACAIDDCYKDSSYPWVSDWDRDGIKKYLPRVRAEFWASSIGAELLFENGLLRL